MSNKDEIFEYVMNNPENTNPAILRGMLNDLNNGGSGGVLAVRISGKDQKVMDKTWQEIADSDFAVCYTTPALGGKYFMYITRATAFESDYEVTVAVWDGSSDAFVSEVFTTDSPDGYPSHGGKA